MTRKEIQNIIIAAGHNEKQVRSHPQMCGCYNCNAIFHNSELEPDNHFCAPGCEPYVVCHYCGMDSIVCSDDLAGLAPLNEETLKEIAAVAFELIPETKFEPRPKAVEAAYDAMWGTVWRGAANAILRAGCKLCGHQEDCQDAGKLCDRYELNANIFRTALNSYFSR